MTFLIRPDLWWIIAGTCALGAIVWIGLEFRRPNRRQWPMRVLAAALGAGAIAALGLRPAWSGDAGPPPAPETAALWTSSNASDAAVRIPRDVSATRVFALAGVKDRPSEALLIPDLAFLRREYPQVNVLHLFGNGLPAFDAENVRGLRLIFHAPASPPATPGIAFVRLQREVLLGDPMVVQGRVEGIGQLASPVVSLLAPDGTTRAVPLKPLEDGTASFTITAPSAPALGRYAWSLEIRGGDPAVSIVSEKIGVSVIPPDLPRVLLLESSPRFDSGRLKRWLGERGAMLASRTQLSRDRFRITAVHGAREEIEILDAGALDAFDLVVADARAIAELGDAEREALRAAIAERGIGLLVVADQTMLGASKPSADGATSADPLLPWQLDRDTGNPDEEDRLVRLQWPGSDVWPRDPLPVPPFNIIRRAAQRPLVRDSQGRALVVASGRGRGQIALSLVRETWRWPQADDSGAFAGFWSYVMSELARPDAARAGRWDLARAGSGPLFVDQPVVLRWSGAPERAPMPAQVIWEGAPEAVRLPLAQDAAEPTRWQSTYWPRHGGWHRVSAPGGGGALDFFVSWDSEWVPLRAAERRAATDRMVAMTASRGEAPVARAAPLVLPIEPARGWFLALLFVSLTYLWLEARSLRRAATA